MKITFWGVRGSIPSPGPKTVRYGGNTTCIAVETDEGELIILDAGSGIHILGQTLLKRLPLKCSIFITHTHWDHIQGLPFFVPLFIPKNEIHIYGTFDPVYDRDIKDILGRQMEYCYFPVREAELRADIRHTVLRERQTVETGSAKVTPVMMNHPVLCFGYLVESNGQRIFFTGDNEPLYNIYGPEDDYYEEYEKLIADKNSMVTEAVRGVDALIADAAYTAQEYPTKKGWGHGTFDSCIAMAKDCEAKALYLTHHDPLRSDEDLDNIYSQIQKQYAPVPGMPEYYLAYEGLEITL